MKEEWKPPEIYAGNVAKKVICFVRPEDFVTVVLCLKLFNGLVNIDAELFWHLTDTAVLLCLILYATL